MFLQQSLKSFTISLTLCAGLPSSSFSLGKTTPPETTLISELYEDENFQKDLEKMVQSIDSQIEETKQVLKKKVENAKPYTPMEYQSADELQEVTLEFSSVYMADVRKLQKEVNTRKELLLSKATTTKQKEALTKTFSQSHTKILELISLFENDVVTKREQALYFKGHNRCNRDLVRGAGANESLYTEADPEEILHCVKNNSHLLQALQKSKIFFIYRIVQGSERPDGIGPMGGLVESLGRLFPTLDEAQLNAHTESCKNELQNIKDSLGKKLQSHPIASGQLETARHTFKAADLLLEYMKDKSNTAIHHELEKYIDDVEFDPKNGTLRRNTDPVFSGRRAALREAGEEGADLQGLNLLLQELTASIRKEDKALVLFGGNEDLSDDWYFLGQRGMTAPDGPAQAVSPVMLGSKCSQEAFENFCTKLSLLESRKAVSGINKAEVSDCDVLDINQLRRRAGVHTNGQALCEMVSKDPQIGKYAYRYAHEYIGTAFFLSVRQIAQALQRYPEEIEKALCEMVKQDQLAIFTIDGKNHLLSILAYAKIVFKQKLKMSGLTKQEEIDHLAYALLAKNFKISGVTAETLKKMDETASSAYGKF